MSPIRIPEDKECILCPSCDQYVYRDPACDHCGKRVDLDAEHVRKNGWLFCNWECWLASCEKRGKDIQEGSG